MFPPWLAAAITMSVAAFEIIASRGQLTVCTVAYGAENHRKQLEHARDAALRHLRVLALQPAGLPRVVADMVAEPDRRTT
jgi:hypothetical protein